MSPAEKFMFEAQLLVHPGLRMDVRAQRTAYALVGLYHSRKKLREELEAIHRQIFTIRRKQFINNSLSTFKQEGI